MNEFILFLQQYAVFPIALICFGIGLIIKHYIKVIPNKFIPLILAVLGIILNLTFNNWQFTVEIILTGAGSGLTATGSFEAVKHLAKKEDKK